MRPWTRRALVAGAATCVGLLLAEAGLRACAPQDLSGSYRVATPSGLLVNKSSGSARHQKGERVVRYTFSPPHLRDSALVPGERTVLCLGDSFTFGWLLAAEDTYVGRLQRLADAELSDDYAFVNAAGAGWGTAECLAFVEEIGPEIRPAYVLVFLNYHDIGRSVRRQVYSLVGAQGFELRRNPIPRSRMKLLLNALPGYDWMLEHSHLAQLLRGGLHTPARNAEVPAPVRASAAEQENAVRLAQALFLRLDEWCDAHGAKLLVTTTGYFVPLADPASFEPTRAFLAGADAFFAEHDIPFRDISPEFQRAVGERLDDYRIPDDGHPNERGAELVADLVFERFLEGLLE